MPSDEQWGSPLASPVCSENNHEFRPYSNANNINASNYSQQQNQKINNQSSLLSLGAYDMSAPPSLHISRQRENHFNPSDFTDYSNDDDFNGSLQSFSRDSIFGESLYKTNPNLKGSGHQMAPSSLLNRMLPVDSLSCDQSRKSPTTIALPQSLGSLVSVSSIGSGYSERNDYMMSNYNYNPSAMQSSLPPSIPRMNHSNGFNGLSNGFNGMIGLGGQQSHLPQQQFDYSLSSTMNYSPISENELVYTVQFKRAHKTFFLSPAARKLNVRVGDFVKVEADRGEDLGVVCEINPISTQKRVLSKLSTGGQSAIKKILRLATAQECLHLPVKQREEDNVLQVSVERAMNTYNLPLSIVDAEYQFDRHKLTIYYQSNERIDFRELVRDLFAIYKTRIWMEHITYSFRPNEGATIALQTGMNYHLLHGIKPTEEDHMMQAGFRAEPFRPLAHAL